MLGLAIAAFGIEQFIFGHTLAAFIPMAAKGNMELAVAYITGILFMLAGTRLWFKTAGKYSAWFPCALFLAICVLLHIPALISNLKNGSQWTVCFELIALAAGSLLAVILPVNSTAAEKTDYKQKRIAEILFAAALIVFSGLHFFYADYISTLIPSWIPFPLFWSYFFGVAFLATGVSILLHYIVRLSCTLLGIMFLTWVLVLHLPRCLSNPHTEAEWTSLFVALAISAAAFLFAETTVVLPNNSESGDFFNFKKQAETKG